MRRLIVWLVAAMLAFSDPALGQAVRPADLAGTWVYRRDGGAIADTLKGQLVVTSLKLDSRGTFAYDGKIKKNDGAWQAYGIGWPKGRWWLAADTLWFKQDRNFTTPYSFKVVLRDGRLLLWDWLMWGADRRDEQCAEKVFERFDASKPLVLPPLPQITIQPTELAGTWVGAFTSQRLGPVVDTLIIYPVDTMKSVHYGKGYDWHSGNRMSVRGPWELVPGNKLNAPGILGTDRIILRNNEMVVCSPIRPVFKRVSP